MIIIIIIITVFHYLDDQSGIVLDSTYLEKYDSLIADSLDAIKLQLKKEDENNNNEKKFNISSVE